MDVVRQHHGDLRAFGDVKRRLDRVWLREKRHSRRDDGAANVAGSRLLAIRARIGARDEPNAGEDREGLERRARMAVDAFALAADAGAIDTRFVDLGRHRALYPFARNASVAHISRLLLLFSDPCRDVALSRRIRRNHDGTCVWLHRQ
jgi:hypothetical protein